MNRWSCRRDYVLIAQVNSRENHTECVCIVCSDSDSDSDNFIDPKKNNSFTAYPIIRTTNIQNVACQVQISKTGKRSVKNSR